MQNLEREFIGVHHDAWSDVEEKIAMIQKHIEGTGHGYVEVTKTKQALGSMQNQSLSAPARPKPVHL